MDDDIGDGVTTDDKRRVVALGGGMLDKEYSGADGLLVLLADDVAVEEGLKIVVTMVGYLSGVEDGFDVWHWLQTTGTGLVVDHPYALLSAGSVGDAVQTVNDSADGGITPGHVDGVLKAEDGEGRQETVGLDEQTHVLDDHLAVDELQTVKSG